MAHHGKQSQVFKNNNMKQIEPQQVWLNGIEYTAQYLKCTGTYDNYESEATIYFQLFTMFVDDNGIETPAEQVSGGFNDISGQTYIDWGNLPAMSVNAWIYNWVAEQNNLTII